MQEEMLQGVDNPCYGNSRCEVSVSISSESTGSMNSSEKSGTIMSNREHELLHASDMSHDSASSALRVDITDIDGEDSLNLTTTHLKLCKRQVLRPYWRLLMFIGWRGFGREYVNATSCGWQVLNTIYPIIITLLLFYTYVYEIVACQWKLDVQKDTQTVPTTTTTVKTTQITTVFDNSTLTTKFYPLFSMRTAFYRAVNLSHSHRTHEFEACEHIVTTYVVPNLLHFVAFVMGLRHFRVQENEQLYALMEKVFLQATPLYRRTASQQKMIRNMRIYLFCSALWVFLVLGMQALYEWAFDFPKLKFFQEVGVLVHWILFIIELIGIFILNSILVAVVVNYVTQCEMIMFYVKGVNLRLQEKTTDLKTAMKDIFTVRQNLSLLNGPIAKMTALVTVIFAELTIIGVSILALNENNHPTVWAYRGLFPVIWVTMLIIPLAQAARVNSICKRFKKIALEIRVFGYKGSSQLELDSFMSFTSHARLRAKLFHIPIQPSYLIATIVLALFIVLILLQTSVIGSASNHLF